MDNKVILYSTHCPKCVILQEKLDDKEIEYEEINDVNVMMEKGFMQAPILEVNGEPMNFVTANKWINDYDDSNDGSPIED